jgi:hypothetical protein
MPLLINEKEAGILLCALGDCRMKKLTKGQRTKAIQDLYARLFDYLNGVKEKPARSYKQKISH